MFSAGELATGRRASEAAMPDTFSVTRPGTEVADGSGGVYTTDDTTTGFPCRKAPVGNGPQERFLAQQIQEVGTEVIVLPWDADVDVGTVGRWTSEETGDVRKFRVAAVPVRTYDIERRCLVVPADNAEA